MAFSSTTSYPKWHLINVGYLSALEGGADTIETAVPTPIALGTHNETE